MLLEIDSKTRIATRRPGEYLKSFGLGERDFQAILFEQLDRLLPDDELMLIMQSRNWREEPDLLAVDANGSLYIFELKAWESSAENLLQVLRYGQIFGQYRYEDLNQLYLQSNKNARRSLIEDHKIKFESNLNEGDFNNEQKFIVVTNGLDTKTREAIRYWRGTGLDMRPWIYRIYRDHGNKMLVELNPFRVEDDPYEDVTQGYYLLNTNIKNEPYDDKYMIEEKRAAAFFVPWKRKIERLSKGDMVFLYRSGQGIVAFGVADGKLVKRAYHGDPNHPEEEYSMGLTNFHEVSPPMTAAEIKQATQSNISFMQTMIALDREAGQKLYVQLRSR